MKDLDLEDIWYVKPVNGALTAEPLGVCPLAFDLGLGTNQYLHIFQDHPYASDSYNKDLIFSVVQGLGTSLAKEIYFLI